jgi:hypothetical protein
MFSMTTIASSTTKPVAMTSAIRVRLLMEKPAKYMTPKVPTSESGTATLGIAVAAALRRKRKMTSTTSAIAKASSIFTSLTEARIVVVRSERRRISTDPGSVACSCGSRRVTRSTTWITFEPGWRWMLTITAALSFAHAANLTFSASSTASATSVRRMARPPL